MNEIHHSIDDKLDYYKNAPYKTPVRKLNETKANRELDIKWNTKD